MNVIEIQELTKKYHQQYAIKNVHLTIKQGEIFGFIGPNGAGKSTTIKAMLNFIYPDQGQVKLLGMDSVKEAKAIRKRTGYVSSDVRLYPTMTVKEILASVAKFHQLINTHQKIAYFTDLFELDLEKKIANLSLGNKKKVALAGGLLADPELLILDEPTNGLDPLMQHRLFEELERKNKAGMTIFLSSHDLNEVQQYAHRAAFIRQGEIITTQDISREKSLGKVLTLTGKKIPLALFEKLGGAILKQDDTSTRVLYQGDLKALLPLLADPAIDDFTITNPELEDQFMALYEGGSVE